eukprot:m.268599 g.268599  ORF g.268599 m.268599 type:complete len:2132 (-) comp16059_c0_seq3:59-6454(-)
MVDRHVTASRGLTGWPSRALRLCLVVISGVAGQSPSVSPTSSPTLSPSTTAPTVSPSASPTRSPSLSPTTSNPTSSPTLSPSTTVPSASPTTSPSLSPTTSSPSSSPTGTPTASPMSVPTVSPTTTTPSASPTLSPSTAPSVSPSSAPTTTSPTASPSVSPTTTAPTASPTSGPTTSPTTHSPTTFPTLSPSSSPSISPTVAPTLSPTSAPTLTPSLSPTQSPSLSPSVSPTASPTMSPTASPSSSPTISPSTSPSSSPTTSSPTASPTPVCIHTGVPDNETLCRNADCSVFFQGIQCPGFCPQFCTAVPTQAPTVSPTLVGALVNITVTFPSITLLSIQGTTFVENATAALIFRVGSPIDQSHIHSVVANDGSVLLSVAFLAQTLGVVTAQQVAAGITGTNPLTVLTDGIVRQGTSATVTISSPEPTIAPTGAPTVIPTAFPTPACPYGADPPNCRNALVVLGFTETGAGFNCVQPAMALLCPAHCNACTVAPTSSPTLSPTNSPTTSPTGSPTVSPTVSPSTSPTTSGPSISPSASPTLSPTVSPTVSPTPVPTVSPTVSPSVSPSVSPTMSPTQSPSTTPSMSPSRSPTTSPTFAPSTTPTVSPSVSPTVSPTLAPSVSPSISPTTSPTVSPTLSPTLSPTTSPSTSPSVSPTDSPTSSPTQCTAGEFLNATTGSCQICTAPGTFMNLTDHNSPQCDPWSLCTFGQFASDPGTHLVDRTCSACPDGQFRDTTDHIFTFCEDWTQCQSGQFVTTAGTTSSDVVCSLCQAGTFNNFSRHLNVTCDPCGAGSFASGSGAANCLDHTECSAGLSSLSIGGVYPVLTVGNATHDTVCQACSLRGNRHVLGTVVEAQLCAACPAETFNSVNPVTFPVSLETATQSITCTPMVNCTSGQFSNYNNIDTSQTVDRTCSTCSTGEYMNLTDHTETACFPHTECSPGSYESAPGTLTSDTICTDWSLCPAGEYALDDTVVPWFNQDRNCSACEDGKFISDSGHSIKVCTTWGFCNVNTFYVTGSESVTSDRLCSPCPGGSTVSFASHLNTSCVAAASPSTGNDQAITVGVVSGAAALFFLLLILALALFARARRQARKPEDMEKLQEEMRKEFGLGKVMSFGDGSLGVSVSLQGDIEMIVLESIDLENLIRNRMGLQISKLPGKPMIDEVQFDATSNSALLVLSPPSGSTKPFNGDKIVAVLDRTLKKEAIEMRDARNGAVITAFGAAQALPRRVPREIAINKLLRLEKLGEGNFAEVFRAQVDERERHMPPYPVAAKVLKGGLDPEIRKAFLREAALMAMFEHPHIVQLVGVCTVPADMPPLLLMQFCDRGSLESYLRSFTEEAAEARMRHEAEGFEWEEEDERQWRVDDTVKLTFAGDVCQGLQYLATCRIIHRDIAARNVLLDAAYICRIADFGQSQALTDNKDYVRMYEQTAVRWAAREVLEEDKFSAASDVWSFGVLLHEIMSMAELPYKDLATNTMVIDFVSRGGMMGRHPLCAPTVYNQLILPCWKSDPVERIHFDELLELIQQLGGSSEANNAHSPAGDGMDSYDSNNDDYDETAVLSLEERKLQAPSVWHLNSVLRHKLELVVIERPKSLIEHIPADLTDLRIYQMVELYTKPIGQDITCPRDFELGCAYVDTLVGRDNVGRATALLSYSWGNRYFDICDALMKWVEVREADPRRAYIWICSLCLNQHRIVQVLTPEELTAEFGPRVTAIGRLIPFLDPWDAPMYVQRAWCLFEMFTAISLGGKCKVDITLSPGEETRFKESMVNDGYSEFDKVLAKLSSKNAQATQSADLDAIFKLIETVPGKFGKIDATVKGHLRRWAAEYSGAVRTNARMDLGIRGAKNSTYHTSTSASTSGGPTFSTTNSGSDSLQPPSYARPSASARASSSRPWTSASRDQGVVGPKFYTRAVRIASPGEGSVPSFPLSHQSVSAYSEYVAGSLEEDQLIPEIPDLRRHLNKMRQQMKKNRAHIRELAPAPPLAATFRQDSSRQPLGARHRSSSDNPAKTMRMVTRTETAGFGPHPSTRFGQLPPPAGVQRPPSSGGQRSPSSGGDRPQSRGSQRGSLSLHGQGPRPFSPPPSHHSARRVDSFHEIRKATSRRASPESPLPPVRLSGGPRLPIVPDVRETSADV